MYIYIYIWNCPIIIPIIRTFISEITMIEHHKHRQTSLQITIKIIQNHHFSKNPKGRNPKIPCRPRRGQVARSILLAQRPENTAVALRWVGEAELGSPVGSEYNP
jgi:hypothetical protein